MNSWTSLGKETTEDTQRSIGKKVFGKEIDRGGPSLLLCPEHNRQLRSAQANGPMKGDDGWI